MKNLQATIALLALTASAAVGSGGTWATGAAEASAQTGERVVSLDWPWFRGPNRDGISPETGLLDRWPEAGPPELWRVSLGSGFSSVSVVDGRLFTMFGSSGGEYLAAFDASTGSELWRLRLDRTYENGQGDGPRSTPAVEAGVVYALGGTGVLVAADAGTGGPLWRVDLRSRYAARGPTWGFSSQPLLVGQRLLLDVGGRDGASIVALDKATGEEIWRGGSDKPGYSMPLLVTVGGVDQAVFFTGESVLALDPETGAPRWRYPWQTSYDVNAASPLFVPPDKVFVSSGYGTGSALLRLIPDGDAVTVETAWRSRELKNQFSSSVLVGDYIYGFDNSIMVCIEIRRGQRLWRARGYGHGSLLFADGRLIVLGDRGQLALVEATPGEHVEISRTEVFDSKTWTPPTLVNGILYLRDERELVALDLNEPLAQSAAAR